MFSFSLLRILPAVANSLEVEEEKRKAEKAARDANSDIFKLNLYSQTTSLRISFDFRKPLRPRPRLCK